MDYDVVRLNAVSACRNYKQNDAEFYSAMHNFYKEGKKNPSVARIILQDYIIKSQKNAGKMLNEAAAFSQCEIPAILYPEFADRMNEIYNLSSAVALRSIDIADIYKETKFLSDDLGNHSRKEFDEVIQKFLKPS